MSKYEETQGSGLTLVKAGAKSTLKTEPGLNQAFLNLDTAPFDLMLCFEASICYCDTHITIDNITITIHWRYIVKPYKIKV